MPERRPFDLLVRNGTLVRPAARRRADIGIRDGVFAEIGRPETLDHRSTEELDATGLFVLPGLIDAHVHFREPGMTHKEDWLTGSRAAVIGGITTVLDMPNTIPPTDSPANAEEKLRLADQKSYCDFGLLGLLSDESADRVGELADVPSVVGLKVFLGPTTGDLRPPSDANLLRGLRAAAARGLRVCFHAEDAAVFRSTGGRPVEAEVVAIEHLGHLLEASGAAGHVCHVSSAEGLAAIERWRSRGLDLTAEVTPHHCFLTADKAADLGALAKVYPPIRDAAQGVALLAALAAGQIEMVASDHAPHTPAEKLEGELARAPAGIAGVETSLALFLTRGVNEGRMSLERLAAAMAEAPARAWGLWPRKGVVAVGSDADLTIVDLEREGIIRSAELHGKHGLTPFEGWPTRGAPVATIVRGRVVMRAGELLGEPEWGRSVSRLRGGRVRGTLPG